MPHKSNASQNTGSVSIDDRSYIKHSQHWYEDGNFGFLVEEIAFLVHRSVLSRRSSLMADLFSLPQRAPSERDGNLDIVDSSLVIDGAPYVVLHDKAEDFANVLNIIYPESVPTQTDDGPGVISILGVVRFSRKYLFDDIKAWGISKLKSDPVFVPDKDGLMTAFRKGLYSDPEQCTKVILLSRECDLPEFLPLAFYSLATSDWGNTSLSKNPLCLDQLAEEDRRRVQEGRVALTRAVIQRAHNMPENACTTQRCPVGRSDCRQGLPTLWLDPAARWTELVLHPLEELGFRLTQSSGVLCNSCLSDLHRTTRDFRDDLVERMGEFFRFDAFAQFIDPPVDAGLERKWAGERNLERSTRAMYTTTRGASHAPLKLSPPALGLYQRPPPEPSRTHSHLVPTLLLNQVLVYQIQFNLGPYFPMVEEATRAPESEPKSAAILDKAVVLGGRTYTMHSRHWNDDGSFGFLVENTAFLLHRSILARKSSVMADMFGLPQRSSSSPGASDHALETINGIPFVVLHDKAEDLTNILDIIYTDISMAGKQSALDVTTLMGIVTFANKYLFDQVKEWALPQISSSRILLVTADASRTSSLQYTRYSNPQFCVRVIQFSREFQLPQFLPLAFYALATTDWSLKSRKDLHRSTILGGPVENPRGKIEVDQNPFGGGLQNAGEWMH
ncbi:hypothetical protein FS837_009779 [Tulasnella sp. UAMH 9824]|nr:hypothetical protein FS837_009779 [Tulasnella sp. UAMH 9824]